jgi:hypothetical protein
MENYISEKYEGIITVYCMDSRSINPTSMARDIMKHSEMRMHGPEHHYLTAAVIVTAYCNEKDLVPEKTEMLKKALFRTGTILPGACGLYGVCGDVQAVGAAISIILGVTPFSTDDLKVLNAITGKCQQRMAGHKGPRCCKRATFLNIYEAAKCMNSILKTGFIIEEAKTCEFSRLNESCSMGGCQFYHMKSSAKGKQ